MTAREIAAIRALEIVDCRLEPTLRVTVETTGGVVESADVPCGRSRGEHEAVELRDETPRFSGLGVSNAIEAIESTIEPALCGYDVTSQRAIDERLREIDGTANFATIGGNAATGVSLAVLKAGAAACELPLYSYLATVSTPSIPVPFFDMIEGGELAATDLAFQEHQLVPIDCESFSSALHVAGTIYSTLGTMLAQEWDARSLNVGVEGGYTPPMTNARDAFDTLLAAADECGYEDTVALSIDAAASHFYDSDSETYDVDGETYSRDELIAYYEELTSTYPIISIEDPLYENDLDGYATLTRSIGDTVQIVGDDLFVTAPERLRSGIDADAATALLLKVNQVGTVSAAIEAATIARENGYAVQVSERSGQTPDTWLAELAVGLDASQLKTGMTRGERTEQYNRLLEIENDDTAAVPYAGSPI